MQLLTWKKMDRLKGDLRAEPFRGGMAAGQTSFESLNEWHAAAVATEAS